MKLEDICISLHTAQKLVDCGIVVDSIHSWVTQYLVNDVTWTKLDRKQNLVSSYGYSYKQYPAPTAEELIALLPLWTQDGATKYYLDIGYCELNFKKTWLVRYEHDYMFYGDMRNLKLCETLAGMLLWLKEEGHI